MIEPYDIDRLLDDIITLPSQPQTLARISQLIEDPSCSLEDVGKAISADPSIAIKALRLVNSAHYGLRNRVISVEHAAALLGLNVLRNLVLTATVFEAFKKGAEALLLHSVACGVAMRCVAGVRGGDPFNQIDDMFVYGLVHDIGKIVIREFLPDETARAEQLSRDRKVPSFQTEREIIGCDHAQIGARLAKTWMLPDHLVEAVEAHHDLSQCRAEESRELAAMLAISDYICWASGMMSARGAYVEVQQDAFRTVQLTSRDLPPILDQFFAAIPEIRELMQLAG